MTDPPRPDFLELADYTGVLRRRGWIALALAGLGALVSVVYLAVAPASYQATADVYVTPNSANQNVVLGSKGTSTAVNMDNEAQIVESNTVAVLAARTLRSRMAPQALLGQVSVLVPANTAVLAITCSASSPGSAAACAQAFARGYLTARHTTATDKLAFELTQEQAKAASLESRSVTLHDQIGRLAPGSADRAQAVLELKTVSAKLDTLRTNISAINASVNTNPGYIITSAVPPPSAASPQPLLYLPSGLLAGLLAGLVAAFAADRRDDRVHTVRELDRVNGLPVLYSVDARRLSPPGAVAPARSAAGRGYAELAHAVAAGLGEKDQVLLVAAGSPGPAAGVVAANLAAALARVRADVILVCADPRDTMTPALLGVGAARGLAEVLGGTATVAEVTRQAADVSGLEVITPGRDPATAPSQVRHDVTERLVGGLRRDARYVIICGLASGDGADTFGLAGFADAALVVIELDRTRRPELAACLRRLDRVQTPVLGAALLPGITADRVPRRGGAGRGGADRGGAGRGGRLRFGRAGFDRGHRPAAGAGPARQDQRVSPGPSGSARGSLTRSFPARSAAASGPASASGPAGAGRSPGPARSPGGGRAQDAGTGAGRASAALADPGRVPPGLRPLPPSRSGRQPRWEPAEPASAQPPWDADDSPWDADAPDHQEPPWDASGPVSKDLSWGADDPAGRESPNGPSGRSRPESPWDSAAPAGTGPADVAPPGTGPTGAGPAARPGPGEPPWAASEPGRPEPAWGPGPAQPPRAEPLPGPARPSRPEPPRSAAGPSRPGSSGAGASRPEPPWGSTAPSWSEPAWPVSESAWPEPMWGGLDPSRPEPPGGTADPAKSEAPRAGDQQSRSGPPSWRPTETWPLPTAPRDPGAPRARPSDPQDRATGTG
ncbi:MAG TPA: Wzz/FepE/Etk N-terminal domain-containing protein [Streptosporangiaceae bacterium]|nr:Wzz/FepE/Etk N-terminal domain-containing protein [Streptosporangiaceae bacterium]